MALGSTYENVDGKLFILKIKRKDADLKQVKPFFAVYEKDEEGKYPKTHSREINRFSGDLTKVDLSKFPWEGNEIDVVKLTLKDGDETYLLDTRLDSLTRNLYNSLFGLSSFNNLEFSLYETKPNAKGKVYPAVSVRQNENRADWKYKIGELPTPEEIKNKKGEILSRDYSDLNAFFVEKLQDLAERVKSAPKTAPTPSAPKQAAKKKVEDDDSIPGLNDDNLDDLF